LFSRAYLRFRFAAFTRLFVFNDLTPFFISQGSFPSRTAEAGEAAVGSAAGLTENFWKTITKRRPIRQGIVVFIARPACAIGGPQLVLP
jgi:hypothetical protein